MIKLMLHTHSPTPVTSRFALMIGLLTILMCVACAPDQEAIYLQGRQYITAKKYRKALETFDQLEEVSAESPSYQYKAQYGRSTVYRMSGDLKREADTLTHLLNQDRFKENHAVLRDSLEENLLTQAKRERSKADPRLALKLYQRALKLNPKSEARTLMTEYLNADAQALIREHRLKEALKLYQEARTLNEGDETLSQQIDVKIKTTQLSIYRSKARVTFLKSRKSLMKQKVYNDQTKTFYFKVQSYVEGRVTRKNLADLEVEARAMAQKLATQEVAAQLKIWFELKHEPQVNDAFLSFVKGEFERGTTFKAQEGKKRKRRQRITLYNYYFTFPLDAAYQIAFEATRSAQAVQAPGGNH